MKREREMSRENQNKESCKKKKRKDSNRKWNN